MACSKPLTAFKLNPWTPEASHRLVFNKPTEEHTIIEIPCRQCWRCRLEYSRQWAMRCMHEAATHEDNCLITATYDNDHLPPNGSLNKRDFQLFMKRLRRHAEPTKLRNYYCGEYGDRTGRPHYHALIFGYDFTDKKPWANRNGNQTWRSQTLDTLWGNGSTELGSITFESAAYVARYIMKKQKGKNSREKYLTIDENGEIHYKTPEYCDMSRGKGIGKPWLEKYLTDVYPADHVIMRGKEMKPPRYYFGQYELADPPGANKIRLARAAKAQLPTLDTIQERNAAEAIAIAKSNLYTTRGLE